VNLMLSYIVALLLAIINILAILSLWAQSNNSSHNLNSWSKRF
jgi:hypothetical protein